MFKICDLIGISALEKVNIHMNSCLDCSMNVTVWSDAHKEPLVLEGKDVQELPYNCISTCSNRVYSLFN